MIYLVVSPKDTTCDANEPRTTWLSVVEDGVTLYHVPVKNGPDEDLMPEDMVNTGYLDPLDVADILELYVHNRESSLKEDEKKTLLDAIQFIRDRHLDIHEGTIMRAIRRCSERIRELQNEIRDKKAAIRTLNERLAAVRGLRRRLEALMAAKEGGET